MYLLNDAHRITNNAVRSTNEPEAISTTNLNLYLTHNLIERRKKTQIFTEILLKMHYLHHDNQMPLTKIKCMY